MERSAINNANMTAIKSRIRKTDICKGDAYFELVNEFLQVELLFSSEY